MGYIKYLTFNNKEKMNVLLHIFPAVIIYMGMQAITGSSLIAMIFIMPVVALFVYGYKTMQYINIISNKYDASIHIDFKQSLMQTIGAVVINTTVTIILILINAIVWIITIVSNLWVLSFVALFCTVLSVFVFATVDKLVLYVIYENMIANTLGIKDYLNNFEIVYKENFRFVFMTMIKVVILSFIITVILSLISINAMSSGSYIVTNIIVSVVMSFLIYWVDVTAIQLLINRILNNPK